MNKLDKTFKINPLYESDSYKVGHKDMLAPGTTREYWTWIARNLKNMHPSIKKIMAVGGQLVVRYLHSNFKELFFDQPVEVALKFARDMSLHLGTEYNGKHFKELHELGYLPIIIQSLEEGTFTNPNIPHMAGINTKDGYAWLGLYLETLISKLAWQMPTAATITAKFRENSLEWVKKTDSENIGFVDFMNHDFHSRGGNPFTSIAVGLGHALSSKGSDTLNVIPASRYYYDFPEDEVPIFSVNASEHSVTCTGIFYYQDLLKKGKLDSKIQEYYSFDAPCEGSVENPDYLAIAEWLNMESWLDKFPNGILSYVCDTFNTWKLITYILPRLKAKILARNGKLVIRPDTGDPADIICGNFDSRLILTVQDEQEYETPDEAFEAEKDHYHYSEHGDGETAIYRFKEKLYKVTFRTGDCIEATWDHRIFDTDVTFEEYAVPKDNESKGVVELLYEIFGGDKSKEGYIRLDKHIGAIYGDSINLERQVDIYFRLAEKGFAATNIVLGVGSYTYVMLTRDSAGYAAKGAWFETIEQIDSWLESGPELIAMGKGPEDCWERKGFNIYKDPATGDGTKKSLKGFQLVYMDKDEEIKVESEVSEEVAFSDINLLKIIYKDGEFFNQTTLTKIINKLNNN